MRHLFELCLFFILLMGLPDWYIYRQYIRQWKHSYLRWLYWVPSVLLLIGMLIIFGSFTPHSDSMKYLSLFLITFLCINVPKVVFTLMAFLLKKVTQKIGHSSYANYMALALSLFTMGYLLFGATEGKSFFQVKEVNIESKDIPEEFDVPGCVAINEKNESVSICKCKFIYEELPKIREVNLLAFE